jgi:hypothetical protein
MHQDRSSVLCMQQAAHRPSDIPTGFDRQPAAVRCTPPILRVYCSTQILAYPARIAHAFSPRLSLGLVIHRSRTTSVLGGLARPHWRAHHLSLLALITSRLCCFRASLGQFTAVLLRSSADLAPVVPTVVHLGRSSCRGQDAVRPESAHGQWQSFTLPATVLPIRHRHN